MLRQVGILIMIFFFVILDIRIFDSPVILALPQEEWDEFLRRTNQLIFWFAIWNFTFAVIAEIKHIKRVVLENLTSSLLPPRAQTILTLALFASLVLLTLLFIFRLEHIVLEISSVAH